MIVPVYGVEQYIARCLDSVFSVNLSEDEYEVICVDDCTKDNSNRIIEGFQKVHSNLRLIHHGENKRQGGARNTGISQAKGRFLIFVDADDRLPKYDISEVLHYMEANQLELLLGAAECYGTNGSVKRWGNAPMAESAIMNGPQVFTNEYIHKIAFGVVWMAIYKSELVRRVGPFVEKVSYEDTDWTLRCAYEAKRLQFRPIVIYHYMENPLSTTGSRSVDSVINRVKQGLRVWKWAQTTIENHDNVMLASEDYCTWNLSVLKSLRRYGYSERKKFYHTFTKEEMNVMKKWQGEYRYLALIKYPNLSQAIMFFVSPLFRMGEKLLKIRI